MSGTGFVLTLSPRDYDAVLFDLDGVLTRTADVHATAWKKLFDDFLAQRARETGTPFEPFDIETDYRRYVDGKPRYDGVTSFLAARGVTLPFDPPQDAPDSPSVRGLGQKKDTYFRQHLSDRGVAPYESSLELVRTLRAHDVKTAVVSSSANCAAVLDAVGIADLFDERVDGTDIVRLGLKGKPAPDAFLEAARRLNVEPARAVVVEDATSGVAAGRAGRFGSIIGVDRSAQSQALRDAGADVVVTSLGQVQVAAEPPASWTLAYDAFDPAREGMREALCALGNGYFATRGAAAWSRADGVHYPGTYLAGGYNRLTTEIAGRSVENESLVNLPNWLPLTFRIGDGEWFDTSCVTLLSYCQELDLKRGMLKRQIRFEDAEGRVSLLCEKRLVSMADMHVAAMELTLKAENWSAEVAVRSALDGRVVNDGAKLYRRFRNRHLDPVSTAGVGDDGIFLMVRTSQSDLGIAQAARTRAWVDGAPVTPARRLVEEEAHIAHELAIGLARGQTLVLEKIVALHTSRDRAISECGIAARKTLARTGRFEEVMGAHVLEWKNLWRRFDVHMLSAGVRFKLNVPMLLRLNMFHLLQAASLNSVGLDIGVPARGWTGEAYEGHIFWDELFIFPTLNFRTPEITRSLLLYRYRRLDEARAAARRAGQSGAMFPWQSGSDGQEETQEVNLNPYSKRWVPDNSYLQRHVGSAVAYNVWQYYQVTHDVEFMQFYGAELMLEIARFWAGMARFDEARERYVICGVVGPDEFHEGYPGASEPGLNNNAYTNVLAVWVLCRALEALELLPTMRRAELAAMLGLTEEETARWSDVSRRMFVPFHDEGIVSQFEGYGELKELDWERYRLRYGNIQRLDLILEAEHDSANRYKLSKQADVLMLFYLFSEEELRALFERLGYSLEADAISRNVAYYDRRSSHGSTLSRVVHAWVLARTDRRRAMRYFAEALQSDVSDIQQGTTAEGIHLGAMAGTVDLLQRVSTGMEVTHDVLRLDPRLPQGLARFDLRMRYRGHSLDLKLTRETLTVRSHEAGVAPIRIRLNGETHELAGGATRVFELRSAEEAE